MELYDLSTDPEERKDVRGQQVLSEEWQTRLESCWKEAMMFSPGSVVRDAEAVRCLRALGYLR